MEESSNPDDKRLEKWIGMLSRGETGRKVDVEALKGITPLKLHKGFVLCDFLIHNGVTDESGKWHEGAMITLMDVVSSWAAFSLTSRHHITACLSVSFHFKPHLQEVVEIEAKAMGEKGRMTSVSVEVRTKLHRQMVASGIMWMSQAHSKDDTKTLYSKI